jgi:hypothetical protein
MTAVDPAEARKRRKEIIQSQRSEGDPIVATNNNEFPKEAAEAAAAAADSDEPAVTEKKPPKKRKVDDSSVTSSKDDDGKKTQIRYDPEVPMSKEQLAAWRREARRVRNRESAAASRQRIRSRITELEEEVGDWKSKYTQAMERLQRLETVINPGADSSSKN